MGELVHNLIHRQIKLILYWSKVLLKVYAMFNLRANSSQEKGNDRGLSKEEEFGLGGFNMDGPITWARSKRLQEELGKRLNSLMEERENDENPKTAQI